MVSPIAIGMTTFNRAAYLTEALESLLGQTHPNFTVSAVDNASTDGTQQILHSYASHDKRFTYTVNPSNVGSLANWHIAFWNALDQNPDAAYFAWASDHDLWELGWASTLANVLDAHPDAVLAYGFDTRISAEGQTLRGSWSFDTSVIESSLRRFWAASTKMSAGNMAYGLFRIEALKEAGVPYRPIIGPDRLMLAELSLIGKFVQTPEILWHRRFAGIASVGRQRTSLFGQRPVPWWTWLPHWVEASAALIWNLGIRKSPSVPRFKGWLAAALYVIAHFVIVWGRTRRRYWGRMRIVVRALLRTDRNGRGAD